MLEVSHLIVAWKRPCDIETSTISGPIETLGLNRFFIVSFAISAWLFQHAGRDTARI